MSTKPNDQYIQIIQHQNQLQQAKVRAGYLNQDLKLPNQQEKLKNNQKNMYKQN